MMDLVGSGLVNEAEEGKSAEPTEKAKEEVQGGDQPLPISSWYSSSSLSLFVFNCRSPSALHCTATSGPTSRTGR
jgi:hypothetical protein